METVLADDFSGASEIAGVGFRYGLTAAVHLDLALAPSCDLTVLDIDSRSKPAAEAVRLVCSALDRHDCVFKKIDSVLRGHVLAEIQPFLQSGRYQRALVVPFNPELGRTIKEGVYWIDGRPISDTAFRCDPGYPALTSGIVQMLGPGGEAVSTCRLSDPLPETGIFVGEGETREELLGWARRADEKTLPVGGAPFFAAWLEAGGETIVPRLGEEVGRRVLVVSGTTSRVVDWRCARENGEGRVLPMPLAVFEDGCPDGVTTWARDVELALDEVGFAVASIGAAQQLDRSRSRRLVGHLAELAASVLARCPVDQLWLEGGATASAVIRGIGWTALDVVGELAPGVVQLRRAGGGPLVTVKPGSYPWNGESRRTCR